MSRLRKRSTYRSTHPSAYYARQRDEAPPTYMQYAPPSWIERNGEFITAIVGASVILLALLSIGWALTEAAIR